MKHESMIPFLLIILLYCFLMSYSIIFIISNFVVYISPLAKKLSDVKENLTETLILW